MMSGRAALLVGLPVIVLSVTACGGGSSTKSESSASTYATTGATTIDQDMRAAMKNVKSLHVYGTHKDGSTTYTVDESVDSSGNCTATVTGGSQSLKVTTINGTDRYVQANADYWIGSVGVSKATAAVLANRWFSGVPATALPDVCSLSTVIQPFSSGTVAKDAPSVLGTTTASGLPAVNLKVVNGTSTATIAVSASNPHYVLTLATADGTRTEILSQFDKPVAPAAPQGAPDLSTFVK